MPGGVRRSHSHKQVALPGGLEILLTDTVGFIQKLPTTLVAAFKSTLEELQEASLIVNLVDISSTGARAQMHAVENVLAQVLEGGVSQVFAVCDWKQDFG